MNSNLVAIRSQRDQDDLKQYVNSIKDYAMERCFMPTDAKKRAHPFWTAGWKARGKEKFVWKTKTTEVDLRYNNWRTSKRPNNAEYHDSCLSVSADKSYPWDGGSCDTKMCFVCEIKVEFNRRN